MMLFFLSTYGWASMEYDNPDTFVLIGRDAEILPRIIGVLYGIFAAFCMFRFLWSRRECGMTLSVGVTRWKQFTLRYLFGLLSVMLAVVVPLLLAYHLEMRTMGEDPVGVCAHYTAVYMIALFVVTALSYTVGVLIAVLCGNFLPAMLSTVGVLVAPYALLGGLQKMLETYLFGSPHGETLLSDHLHAGLFTMLTESLQSRSYTGGLLNEINSPTCEPWLPEYLKGLKAEISLPTERVIFLLILLLGIALFACYAYCRRPAEHAGKTYVHSLLTYAVALPCGFGLSALVLYIPVGMLWLTVLLVSAFLAAVLLLRLILVRSLRSVLRGYAIPCGAAGLCIVLSILLGMGWFGYASYVPDAADVASVRVTYNQNRTLFPGLPGGAFSQGLPQGASQALGGYGIGDEYLHFLYVYGMHTDFENLPEMTQAEDIQKVLSIHEAIVDGGQQTYTKEPAEVHEDTVINADYRIVYKLKNGKTVERYYHYLSLAMLETTMQVEDTAAYRSVFSEGHDDIFYLEDGIFAIGDPLFSNFTDLPLDEDEQKMLIKALDTDVANLTFEERYFNTGDPVRDTVIGILRCTMIEGNMDKLFMPHPFERHYEVYYLTEAYENTLAFLAERGLTKYFVNPYTVESVRIRPYTPRFYDSGDRAPSYVFFSCENVVQALSSRSDIRVDVYTALDDLTTPVPESAWDAHIQNSRAVALMTRPGVMVQITLTNARGEKKLVTRYLYDGAIGETVSN
jgi:hypothetical protein